MKNNLEQNVIALVGKFLCVKESGVSCITTAEEKNVSKSRLCARCGDKMEFRVDRLLLKSGCNQRFSRVFKCPTYGFQCSRAGG